MKTTIETCKFRIWSPKTPSADDITRLAIAPLHATDKLNSSVKAVVATDGKKHHQIVPDEHIAAFLQQHATTHFIFAKVGTNFWAIHRHLQHDKTAARAWRKRIATGKFSSVLLLDQLVQLATASDGDNEAIPQRTLDEITDDLNLEIVEVELPDQTKLCDLGSSTRLRSSAEIVVLLMRAYKRLRRKARSVSEAAINPKEVFDGVVEQFGWLTEHLQAAADIALAKMSHRGVVTDSRRHKQLHKELSADQLRWAKNLADLAPNLLLKDGKEFQFTDTGRIRQREGELDTQLRKAFQQFQISDPQAILPMTGKGNISRSAREWHRLYADDSFITCWYYLEEVQKQLHSVRQLGSALIQPNYSTLTRSGRTSCSKPALQSLPRKGDIRELIVPRDGYALLTIDIHCFELAALGAICRHHFGRSKLADVLEAGHDPHAWTAAALNGTSYEKLQTLKRKHPERFQHLRNRAKPVNFGVPGGMSARTLAEYARDAYDVRLSLAEADIFRKTLITEVYPELMQFLQHSGDASITLTGRVRGGVCYTQYQNTQFQGLAADAAKLALARLIAKGCRVVLFVHDEFVIEIASDGATVDSDKVRSIVEIVQTTTEEVLGVAVTCTYSVSDRWSKNARNLQEIGGATRVWTPKML